MLDIKFLRENPDIVKENIKKKYQDRKLPMVDEAIELDQRRRDNQAEADQLRADKNKISKEIGKYMAQGDKEAAEETKKKVAEFSKRLAELEEEAPKIEEALRKMPDSSADVEEWTAGDALSDGKKVRVCKKCGAQID